MLRDIRDPAMTPRHTPPNCVDAGVLHSPQEPDAAQSHRQHLPRPRPSSLVVSSGSAAVTRTSLCEWCCNLSGHVAIEPGGAQEEHLQGPQFHGLVLGPGMWTRRPDAPRWPPAAAERGS